MTQCLKTSKGATWQRRFLVDRFIIGTGFSPSKPCSLELFERDSTRFGKCVVFGPFEGDSIKSLLAFSPVAYHNNHGTEVSSSRKRSDGIVMLESVIPWEKRGNCSDTSTGVFSIELYTHWPPLDSNYEVRA
jgi:hypothetical protein